MSEIAAEETTLVLLLLTVLRERIRSHSWELAAKCSKPGDDRFSKSWRAFLARREVRSAASPKQSVPRRVSGRPQWRRLWRQYLRPRPYRRKLCL